MRMGKKIWAIILSVVMCAVLLCGCGSGESAKSKELQENISKVPQLVEGLDWGMSLEEITEALGITKEQCVERPDLSSALYTAYDISDQEWNGYPVSLRLLYCPVECENKKPLGLVTIAITIQDTDVTTAMAEEALTKQYECLYPQGDSQFPSMVTGHELDWYTAELKETVKEKLVDVYKQVADSINTNITPETWADVQTRSYFNVSTDTVPSGDDGVSKTAIYVMAFSAAMLRQM